jgi:hypothetical protein
MSVVSLSSNELIAQLCDARDQLDRGISLINEALDLREQLWWSIDMDDARIGVDNLVRAIQEHRRSRS